MRPGLVSLTVLALAGCGALPQWSANPADIPSLEARLASLPTDVEARLRLAGTLWEAGDRREARLALSDGLSHHPGHPSLLALEARAAHLSDDLLAARAAYLEGATRAVGTPLSEVLAQNAADLGPASAEAIAGLLVNGGGQFNHGGSSLETAAIFPITVAGTMPRPDAVGRALTELLVFDLRRVEPFSVIDRSLTSEIGEFLGDLPSGEAGRDAAARVSTLLSVGHVVWGSVEARASGEVAVQLTGFRLENDVGVISEREVVVPAGDLGSLRAQVAYATWTLMVGGAPGPEIRNTFVTSARLTLDDLVVLGEGLELADERQHDAAARSFDDLLARVDGLEAAEDLAERERRLRDILSSSSLGLEPEAIGLARQMRTMADLRSGSDLTPLSRAPSVNEMFGQDRLGFQHLAEFIIRVGSGS